MSAGRRAQESEGYAIAHRDELERTGNWTPGPPLARLSARLA